MTTTELFVGSYAMLAKPKLQSLLDVLQQSGYHTVGPRIREGAIIYDALERVEQLPIGYLDQQDGGFYRLEQAPNAGHFDYVVGPHSLRKYVFPPRENLLELHRVEAGWQTTVPDPGARPLAVIGARACDLAALAVLDRTFLGGPYIDPAYQARRAALFLVAVNCRRAAATCFCHSMQTGPEVRGAYDLALTEFEDHFLVAVGTERGGAILALADCSPATAEQIADAKQVPVTLRHEMENREARPGEPRPRSLDTSDIHDLLLGNLEHPRWQEVADRCLSCANCTLVCPTCFCSGVEEVADLTNEHIVRERSWASCFTSEHSYMSSGVVRKTTASRYRQWLTHKLASWIDQFGTSGCVGCGRCITWCPVGIDLTEEVAAIRESVS